jgi:hypothetical protein
LTDRELRGIIDAESRSRTESALGAHKDRKRCPDWRRGVSLMIVVRHAVDKGSRVVHPPLPWLEVMAPIQFCARIQRSSKDVSVRPAQKRLRDTVALQGGGAPRPPIPLYSARGV